MRRHFFSEEKIYEEGKGGIYLGRDIFGGDKKRRMKGREIFGEGNFFWQRRRKAQKEKEENI